MHKVYRYTVDGVKYTIKLSPVYGTDRHVKYTLYTEDGEIIETDTYQTENAHIDRTSKGVAGNILESLNISVD